MQSDNDLEAQKTATEYAFRRRVHEMTQAKNELEWQQHQTAAEIQVMPERSEITMMIEPEWK